MVESLESIANYGINPGAGKIDDLLELKLEIPYTAIINGQAVPFAFNAKAGYSEKNKVLKISVNKKTYFFDSEKNGTNQYIGKRYNPEKKQKKMNLDDLNNLNFIFEAFNKYIYSPKIRDKLKIQAEFDILRSYFKYMNDNIDRLISDEKNSAVLRIAKKTKPVKFKEYSDGKNTVELYKIFHEFKGDENDVHYFFKSSGEKFNNSKKALNNLTIDNLIKNVKPEFIDEAKSFIKSLGIKELSSKKSGRLTYKTINEPSVSNSSEDLEDKMMKIVTSQMPFNKEAISQNKSLMNELKGGIKLEKCSIKDEYYGIEERAKAVLSKEKQDQYFINPQTATVQEINTAMKKISLAMNKLKATSSP